MSYFHSPEREMKDHCISSATSLFEKYEKIAKSIFLTLKDADGMQGASIKSPLSSTDPVFLKWRVAAVQHSSMEMQCSVVHSRVVW